MVQARRDNHPCRRAVRLELSRRARGVRARVIAGRGHLVTPAKPDRGAFGDESRSASASNQSAAVAAVLTGLAPQARARPVERGGEPGVAARAARPEKAGAIDRFGQAGGTRGGDVARTRDRARCLTGRVAFGEAGGPRCSAIEARKNAAMPHTAARTIEADFARGAAPIDLLRAARIAASGSSVLRDAIGAARQTARRPRAADGRRCARVARLPPKGAVFDGRAAIGASDERRARPRAHAGRRPRILYAARSVTGQNALANVTARSHLTQARPKGVRAAYDRVAWVDAAIEGQPRLDHARPECIATHRQLARSEPSASMLSETLRGRGIEGAEIERT
jgi:hypothetical protein